MDKPLSFFNEEETIHFKDVKDLFRLDYAVLLVTFYLLLNFRCGLCFWPRGKYIHSLREAPSSAAV